MTTTYVITKGQLVRLCDGVQDDSIDCDTVFEILASIQLRNQTVTEFLVETAE